VTLNWDECEWIGGRKASDMPSLEEYRKRKEIVFHENGKIYRGSNDKQIRFFTFQVDSGIINSIDKRKCDYLFFDENYKNIFFIELKGKDIAHAFTQLESSLSILKPELITKAGADKFTVLGRIICKSFPSRLYNKPSTKKFMDDFKKKYNSKLIIRESGWIDALSNFY
jgi:hypothetical protein